MIFAQIQTVPAEALKNYILITAGLIATIYYAKGIFQSKQKREITFEFTPASKEAFDNLVLSNRQEHDQLHAKISAIDRGSRDRLEKTVQDFNDKLQSLPSEIIALLRNTGVIK
jgi:hypothetical protein